MAFDRNGNLFVAANLPFEKFHIFEIAPGADHATDISFNNPDGVRGPGLAIDGAGDVFVSGASQVDVYPPDLSAPSRTISLPNGGGFIAVDRAGAMYVPSTGAQGSSISEYAPGARTPTNVFAPPGGRSLMGTALGPAK